MTSYDRTLCDLRPSHLTWASLRLAGSDQYAYALQRRGGLARCVGAARRRPAAPPTLTVVLALPSRLLSPLASPSPSPSSSQDLSPCPLPDGRSDCGRGAKGRQRDPSARQGAGIIRAMCRGPSVRFCAGSSLCGPAGSPHRATGCSTVRAAGHSRTSPSSARRGELSIHPSAAVWRGELAMLSTRPRRSCRRRELLKS